jgi:hypothetical protein
LLGVAVDVLPKILGVEGARVAGFLPACYRTRSRERIGRMFLHPVAAATSAIVVTVKIQYFK